MKGRRIVVADDEPDVLATISELLASAGHTVIGKAVAGDQAVRMAQTLEPDVVVLDMRMPGMDGIESARRIMSHRPVPIVMCTAYFDAELVDKAAEAGVHAYVVKPCRLADLLPAVSMAVSRFEEAEGLKNEVKALNEAIAARK